MTEVRIRHENEGRAHRLGDVPLNVESLDGVLATVKSWGLTVYGDDAEPELVGQFVIDETGAYFEIIVMETEETR